MEVFTKQFRNKIYREAFEIYKKGGNFGMCDCIDKAIKKCFPDIFMEENSYGKIYKRLPEFMKNKPKKTGNYWFPIYWWHPEDRASRIKVFEQIIEETNS